MCVVVRIKPHLNRGLLIKLLALKVIGVLIMGISKLSEQNAIWMWASWRSIEYIIRGKVMASLKFGLW
jgi:hypothetical protein